MKIICVDNYDRPTVSDKLVAENLDELNGNKLVTLLNNLNPSGGPHWYKLVEDDYKLYDAASIY